MTFWLDAQLSPVLAPALARLIGDACLPVKSAGLRDADDRTIFFAARDAVARAS